jgi:hypothetical protein
VNVGLASSPAAGQGTWGGKCIVNYHFSIGIGFSFLPFFVSCFGRLGLTAFWFLAALAPSHLELEQHDQWLAGQCFEHEVGTGSALAASRRDDKC